MHVQARGRAQEGSLAWSCRLLSASPRGEPLAEAAGCGEEPGLGISSPGGGGELCHLTSSVFEQAPVLRLSFFICKEKTLCLAGPVPGLHEVMDVNY